MKVFENISMAQYSTFKLGGKAKRLIIVGNVSELQGILKNIKSTGEKHMFIGRGSNTFFSDKGYDGTVIKLGDSFNKLEVRGDIIVAGAATKLGDIAELAMANDLTGFEFAEGIPGSLGGAVFMNAGAYGGEMSEVIHRVGVVSADGKEFKYISVDDMEFDYRMSRLQRTGEIAVSVEIRLAHGMHSDIVATMADLRNRRSSKQPLEYPSCGSFFKRPKGYFAGKLIDDCGLRGKRIGGVMVSEKHCGFIVNVDGGTATDVVELKEYIQKTVKEKMGVDLHPEVRIIGE